MTQQPEALRLATVLENKLGGAADEDIEAAAAELRRLHEKNAEWERVCDQHLRHIKKLKKRITTLEAALRQAVEALEDAAMLMEDEGYSVAFQEEAITAAKQALEGKA